MASEYCEIRLPESKHECGHFNMDLLLFKTHKTQLETRYEAQTTNLDNSTGPLRHCVYHMLGLLAYALDQKEKALEHFKDVLDENGTNLNALANLEYLCNDMGLEGEAGQYTELLEEFFEDEESTQQLVLAVAEKAFALASDCYADEDEDRDVHRRSKKSNQMYQFALSESEAIEELQDERYKWMFWMAKNNYHMLSRTPKEKKQGRMEILTDSFPRLTFITSSSEADDYYKGQAWCYIGMFLYQGHDDIDKDRKAKQMLKDRGLFEKYQSPMSCFEHADEYGGLNFKTLNRTARFVCFKEKNCQEALNLVEKSLDMNPDPKSNWFGLATRGQIYSTMYAELSKGFRGTHKYDGPDKSFLVKAADDFRRVLESISSPKNDGDLGYVLLRLGLTTGHCKMTDFDLSETDEIIADIEQISEALEVLSSASLKAPSNTFYRWKYEESLQILLAGLFRKVYLEHDEHVSADTTVTRICDVIHTHNAVYQKVKRQKPTCYLQRFYPHVYREISREMSHRYGHKL